MRVSNRDIRIDGRLLRTARIVGEKYVFLDDPPKFIEALRQSDQRIDLFTFMQGLSQRSRHFEYHMELDNLATLPVSTFDDWWNSRINNKTRNILRRSQKHGVTTCEVAFDDALIRGIQSIYDECPIRQGKPFAHYRKTLDELRNMKATFLSQSTFIGAYFAGTLIGFAKLVTDDDGQQAALMHIVSMVRHRDKAPTNALIAQAVKSCEARQIPYLVYSHFAYGNKQQDSLSDFKQHNGFERTDLPRYYVPLTVVGALALRCRMHHTIVQRIPQPVQDKLRTIRSRWNNWRLATK